MRALGPTRLDRQPVRVVEESVRISLWGVLAAWLARKLWRLLIAVAALTLHPRHPHRADRRWSSVGRRFGPVPLLIAAGVVDRGPGGLAAAVAGGVPALGAVAGPGVVAGRVDLSVAVVEGDDRRRPGPETPRHRIPARSCCGSGRTRSVDRVRVRMLPGQTLDDYAEVADRLGQTFGTLDCRIRSVPGRVA